jgi:hypothetical protein
MTQIKSPVAQIILPTAQEKSSIAQLKAPVAQKIVS